MGIRKGFLHPITLWSLVKIYFSRKNGCLSPFRMVVFLPAQMPPFRVVVFLPAQTTPFGGVLFYPPKWPFLLGYYFGSGGTVKWMLSKWIKNFFFQFRWEIERVCPTKHSCEVWWTFIFFEKKVFFQKNVFLGWFLFCVLLLHLWFLEENTFFWWRSLSHG